MSESPKHPMERAREHITDMEEKVADNARWIQEMEKHAEGTKLEIANTVAYLETLHEQISKFAGEEQELVDFVEEMKKDALETTLQIDVLKEVLVSEEQMIVQARTITSEYDGVLNKLKSIRAKRLN